jgi:hypothetical protein
MLNKSKMIKHPINANGVPIRKLTVYTRDRITELYYQLVCDRWIAYKRIVIPLHQQLSGGDTNEKT